MGMSFPGELRRLAAIASPDVAIELKVTPAHLLNFSSVEEIALAKRELVEGLQGTEAVAVLNADDPRVAAMAAVAPGRVIFYGVEKKAEFSAEEIEDRGALGSSFTLVHNGERSRLELSLPGRHVVLNALAAIAAASLWNVGVAEASRVLPNIQTPSMRGELVRFTNGFALINDSYNSSPAALEAMVGLLASTRIQAEDSGGWRDAGIRTRFAAIASRRRNICGQNRENRFRDWRAGRRRANRRRGSGGGGSTRQRQILRDTSGSGRVPGGIRAAG